MAFSCFDKLSGLIVFQAESVLCAKPLAVVINSSADWFLKSAVRESLLMIIFLYVVDFLPVSVNDFFPSTLKSAKNLSRCKKIILSLMGKNSWNTLILS